MPIPLNITSSPNGTRNLPPPPETAPHGGGRSEAINAAFQEVLRQQSELTHAIDRLRSAIAETSRGIGIGHNQGPSIEIEELDAESAQLLALLQDKGQDPSAAEQATIAEHCERLPTLSERVSTLSKTIASEGAKMGAREVAKHVTAPLWEEVARRLLDLYHAIKVWLSTLL